MHGIFLVLSGLTCSHAQLTLDEGLASQVHTPVCIALSSVSLPVPLSSDGAHSPHILEAGKV